MRIRLRKAIENGIDLIGRDANARVPYTVKSRSTSCSSVFLLNDTVYIHAARIQ
jgi:hypothetical protein